MVGKGVMAFLSPPNPRPLENDTKFSTIFWIFSVYDQKIISSAIVSFCYYFSHSHFKLSINPDMDFIDLPVSQITTKPVRKNCCGKFSQKILYWL